MGEILHPEMKTNSESALLPQLLEPAGPRVCSEKGEATKEVWAPQPESTPHSLQLEKKPA